MSRIIDLFRDNNIIESPITKEELISHIQENLEKHDAERREAMQNQMHGNKCGNCIKFQPQSQASKYGYCKFHGVLVLKFNTSCEGYKERIIKDDL